MGSKEMDSLRRYTLIPMTGAMALADIENCCHCFRNPITSFLKKRHEISDKSALASKKPKDKIKKPKQTPVSFILQRVVKKNVEQGMQGDL